MPAFARIQIFLTACCLVLTGCQIAAPSAATGAASAGQWQRWEGALGAQKTHPQPATAPQVDVRFTGPAGATFQVPAFWDAERGFRFRAAFPAAGVWRWQSTCSDPADAGLHGQTGEVRVTAYTGDNAFYRHGDLRVSANQRHLVHADGTPFLWMGDTGWNAVWKGTLADWREYIDVRARQGFSVVQTIATGAVNRATTKDPASGHLPFLDDGTPNALYWRDLEDKIAYANDRGVMILLTGLGNSPAGFGPQQRSLAFARHVAGRLAGHMVILSPSMDQRIDAQNDEAATMLRPLTTHLVTQHAGTHFDTAKHNHDAASTSFTGLQTGHHGGRLDRVYGAARDWTLELWRRPPVKPVINIEAMYDGLGGNDGPGWREQDVRKTGWITWLCGSLGYTYGAGDIPPKVPEGNGGVWRFNTDPATYDYWRKALAWPSATQMTHLRNFFAALEWWRLEPAPELVKNQAEESPRKMAASRTAAGDLLVAYLPDNAEIMLDLSTQPAGLTGRWFSPLTGETVAISEPIVSDSAARFVRPAGWHDAALVLTKTPGGKR